MLLQSLNRTSAFARVVLCTYTALLTVAGKLAGPRPPHNRFHPRDQGLHHPPAVCDDTGEGSQVRCPVYKDVSGENRREG